MKIIRSLLLVTLSILMTLSMTSCALLDVVLAKDKEYRYQELVLSLDSSFFENEIDEENRTSFVSLSGTGAIVIKETFASMIDAGVEDPSSLTVEEYRDAFNEANQYNGTVVELDGLCAFTYFNTSDGTDYKLLVCIYQSETAFWSVQFMAPTADYDKNEKEFIKWAQKVRFEEADA